MVWLVRKGLAMMVAALSGMFDQWVGKRAGNDPQLFLAAFGLVSLPVTVVGVASQPFMWKAALVGLVSGLCLSAGLLLYYRAVAMESLVVLALPGRLVAALALPINALVFDEHLSNVQVTLFILLLAGGWMLAGKRCGGRTRLSRGFWLMFAVQLLYLFQKLLKNMLALEYGAWTMLTWERAGIVLGASLMLIPRRSRSNVNQIVNKTPINLLLILLCRPIANVLISLLAGLAVQYAGSATTIVIAKTTYPFVVVAVTWLVNGKLWEHFRKVSLLSRLCGPSKKPKTIGYL